MTVIYQQRPSDSPLVETVWHVHAVSDGEDMVAADMSWDMIVTRQYGKINLCVWGPMTKAVPIPHLADGEALGIRFKLGTYLSTLPAYSLPNQGTELPEAATKSFWLSGSAWEYPTYENADTFINRLVREGLLGQDAVVQAAIEGNESIDVSLRSVQRRFLRITGLTQRYIRSIERAQQAANLLQNGISILDAVYETGYADQQHMTKALRQLLGQTPAQIAGIRSPK